MNDRELLELAAVAADVFLTPEKLAEVFPEWDWCETDEPYFKDGGAMVGTVVWYGADGIELGGTEKLEWDPLNDDGDALRLAVKLGISVSFSHSTRVDVVYPTIHEVGAFAGWCPTYTESNAADWGAATRRAIVRAAAAIGGALKAAPQSPRPAPGNTDH